MRIIYALFFSLVVGISAWMAFTPSYSPIVKDIIAAFEAGDAARLTEFLSEDIKVSTIDDQEAHTKFESQQLLTDFFEEFPPITFEEKHRGRSKGGQSMFLIGELETTGGIFRINLRIAGDKITVFEMNAIRNPL